MRFEWTANDESTILLGIIFNIADLFAHISKNLKYVGYIIIIID